MAYFLANDSYSAFYFFSFFHFFFLGGGAGEGCDHRTVFTETSHWAVDKNLTPTLITRLAHFSSALHPLVF